jgi:hypothetical protein
MRRRGSQVRQDRPRRQNRSVTVFRAPSTVSEPESPRPQYPRLLLAEARLTAGLSLV